MFLLNRVVTLVQTQCPSRLGEVSSAVLVSAFHTLVDEERLAQFFLTQLFINMGD